MGIHEMSMNTFSPFRMLERSCEEALEWIRERLLQAGLRLMQTFDLQAVRGALGAPPCPHHGSEGCDCRIVVMLVYAEAGDPVTLILHGNDGHAWISIPENSQVRGGEKLITTIQQALAMSG